MKFIFRYLKKKLGIMSLGLLIKTTGTLIELALPFLLSHILDAVQGKSDSALLAYLSEKAGDTANVWFIVILGGAMIFCAAAAMIFTVTANRMASKVGKDVAYQVRHDLFSRTMTLSGRQIDAFTIPSLEARITTDTYNVHNFIDRIQRIGVRAPLLLFGGLAITIYMDPMLSLVMIAMLLLIFVVVFIVSVKGIPLYTRVQKSVDGMVRVVREDSQGIRVIKALSKRRHEQERYDKVNRALVRDEKKASLTMGVVNPVMNLFLNLGVTFVVLIGANFVLGNVSKASTIVAFTQYFTLISNAMLSITRIFVMTTKSVASAERIREVVDSPEDLTVASVEEFPDHDDDDYIVFENVDFSYNKNKNDLHDISFSLPKGGSLGIIGSTGSGKTTLISLLMRFYDVDCGSVRIGGRDVRTIPYEELHTMFGVALQNDFLYSDTIEENIRFGRDLSREQVKAAAKIAQADDFICDFADGYDHVLSQKGTNVSGGQKQRILVARAVAGDPDILILDDSSSALDYKTDANLRRAITESMKNTTSVIIAQRVSSVMNCDLIIVLEEGEIIGMGTHAELNRDCEVYREIGESQMGGAFVE